MIGHKTYSLEWIRQNRDMHFLHVGLRFMYNQRCGKVLGASKGGNLICKFDKDDNSIIMHPEWGMTYSNKKGEIIAQYEE